MVAYADDIFRRDVPFAPFSIDSTFGGKDGFLNEGKVEASAKG